MFVNLVLVDVVFVFFSSRRRHTRWPRDWSSDVCSSDLGTPPDCGLTGAPTDSGEPPRMLPACTRIKACPYPGRSDPKPEPRNPIGAPTQEAARAYLGKRYSRSPRGRTRYLARPYRRDDPDPGASTPAGTSRPETLTSNRETRNSKPDRGYRRRRPPGRTSANGTAVAHAGALVTSHAPTGGTTSIPMLRNRPARPDPKPERGCRRRRPPGRTSAIGTAVALAGALVTSHAPTGGTTSIAVLRHRPAPAGPKLETRNSKLETRNSRSPRGRTRHLARPYRRDDLDRGASTPAGTPPARNSKPETRNSRSLRGRTRHLARPLPAGRLRPRCFETGRHTSARNSKPETRNSKPETRSSKPDRAT